VCIPPLESALAAARGSALCRARQKEFAGPMI
jgi:hypothetical protein